MKSMMPSIAIYFLIVLVCLLLPSSDGYDTFLWKWLIAQIYAIPSLIMALLIQKYFFKKSF